MDKLYIVIPAYNEKDNILRTVSEWYPIVEKYGEDSRLVVINDGSTDETYDILTALAETRPQLTALTKLNGGHGSTVIYGYKFAINKGADWIFQTDSDGQTNPAEFDAFWQLKDHYDAIIGNRTVRGDGRSRKFVENVVCLLLRLIFGVKVKDANAPFRLMKKDLVAKYIDRLPSNYNLPNIMMTTFFSYYHEKLTFREITFKPRQGGKNSINIKKIFKIGVKALKDFRGFKQQMKAEK
ncbi:MAG: glycosyltransferase family 2 protein [Lachnospiraceae bacterium]|nr:glycosyltransferase family 2 protein [Lachnospiraceae bacterium]MBO4559378.1 glycosyltransferase family 2 protein [Lachnospiraceae bacterium]MBR5732845.1 glycosyltransferase family 2 protein [Lachnospiraceae bacterium]